MTKTTFPSGYIETYGYDADNNLTSKTDRKNQTINYVYDALNRLTQKTDPDSTTAAYTYDLVSKILQVNDSTGTYAFAYDNMGRLTGTTTTYSFLPNTPFTNSYGYDADSNRTGFTAPDGSTNTYTYDTLNRLATLANSWAGSFGFSYDPFGCVQGKYAEPADATDASEQRDDARERRQILCRCRGDPRGESGAIAERKG